MKSKINSNLINLAKEFAKVGSKLYIVGGWVRNNLLGYPLTDIDICGSLMQAEVENICKSLGYTFHIVNKKLGTMLVCAGDEAWEYTTFRKENYSRSGEHSPESVAFVKEIETDAKRRDFTCNALYYDILNNQIIDFYNGRKDVEKKLLKCVETPEFVFSCDGLRLLRLVRFAGVLGFKIHPQTLKVAKQKGKLLKDISAERITKELKEIVVSDFKNNINKFKSINLLSKLNYFKYIFNLSYNFKLNTKNPFYKSFVSAPKEFRFKAFLMLVLLNYNKFTYIGAKNIAFSIQFLFGNEGIRCGEDLALLNRVYLFLQEYFWGSLDAFSVVSYHNLKEEEKRLVHVFCDGVLLSKSVLELKVRNIPLNPKELKITNEELMEIVPQKQISAVRSLIFELCVCGKLTNEKKDIMYFIKDNMNKN